MSVTNAPSVFEGTERLTSRSRFVRAALGLHPELAAERAAELPLRWDLLGRTRNVGEIGLDYVTGIMNERVLQRRVFEQIVSRCNDAGEKVLTVHSRRAESDVLDVLHGFRGR
jgi:TatD DNase family protein